MSIWEMEGTLLSGRTLCRGRIKHRGRFETHEVTAVFSHFEFARFTYPAELVECRSLEYSKFDNLNVTKRPSFK